MIQFPSGLDFFARVRSILFGYVLPLVGSFILLACILPGCVSNGQSPDSSAEQLRAEIGATLFGDGILSESGQVACATCHNPRKGFSAGGLPIGLDGKPLARRPPTLFNRAKGKAFFWDGRAASLEEQSLEPITNPKEMGSDLELVLARLSKDKDYALAFRAAFPGSRGVTSAMLAACLAAFERTITREGRYDQFLAGEKKVFTAAESRGAALFRGKALCYRCHAGDNLTDESFHATGAGARPGADLGRGAITGKRSDDFRFKTPTLRGCKLTGPYFHDASAGSLREVIDFYNRGGAAVRNKSADVKPLGLTERERADLLAFLRAL